ncbi:MAG: shikimate kinase, partial [Cyanobacteria bacterium P01_A01_bin.17]
HHGVIDFGAGHSVYEDPRLFESVQQILNPYPNVVLLLPSPNLDESLVILNERNGYEPNKDPNINEHLLRHPSNFKLAKLTVYTKLKTPAETCQEILQLVDSK